MRPQYPAPVPASPQRHTAFLAALALAATLVMIQLIVPDTAPAQLSTTGKWTGASPSALSSNDALNATGIHMAWMRGDPDWVPGSTTRFHSYLFWFNNRTDFCVDTTVARNTNPRFKGGLYGWRPGYNLDNTGDMMSSGFTRIQLDDVDLDPGGDPGGHDIFCSGHSLLDNGLLMVAGGAEAEGAGSFRAAVFDPHVTSGSRWTQIGGLVRPRWYPSIVQTATKDIFAYAGTQHSRVLTVFGRDSSRSEPLSWVGRHAVSSSGSWDGDALPAADAFAASGNPDGQRPRPRYYPAGGAYRVGKSGTTRTVMFGGRDSTQGWSGSGGSAVRSDVWWLEHKADSGSDDLKWVRFNTYTGSAFDQPTDGLWKHSAIVNENTAELWVFGGLDGAGDLNGAVYRGRKIDADSLRRWEWKKFLPSGGPGARQLASAAYDEQYNRMIVYGGHTDASDTTVTTDDDVYALSLTDPPTWKRLAHSNRRSTARPLALAEAAMTQGPDDTEHLPAGVRANMYLYGGTSGGTGASAIKSDVWLMYFPHPDSVSWEKLNIPADPVNGVANHQVPGPRRGATAVRDHNSWNLRVYGGFGPGNAATDGYFYRVDIFRDASSNSCNTAPKPWVPQFATEHHDGGRTGALVVFDPYEVSTTTVEYRTPTASPSSMWQEVANCERFEDFYPLLFPMPDGSFFDATARGFARPTYRFDRPTGSWKFLPDGDMKFLPSSSPIFNLNGGSGVMRRLADGTYDIMKCGLKDTDGPDTLSAHGMTGRLKLSAAGTAGTGVGWVTAGTMQPRVFHNLVTLPDGKVLVMGGASVNTQGLKVSAQKGVQRPQIWDPAGSGSWSTAGVLADEGLFRGYHSVALVMPDGRVVTGGGNDDSLSLPHKRQFKVYAPPQWYDANDAHVTTVTPVNLPDQIAYGVSTRIDVSTSAVVEKVVLLRPGAVTHGFNSSQMYSELVFEPCEGGNGGNLTITSPPANSIPPGEYLLFVVAGGRWSTGQWLRLDSGLSTHFAGTVPVACPVGGCIPTPEDPFCTGGDGGGGFYEGGHAVTRDNGPLAAHSVASVTPKWVTNTLFAGTADGEAASDRLRLSPGPLEVGTVSRVRLSHRGRGSDAYTGVRLVAVDHAETDEALATPDSIVVGMRGAAVSVHGADGVDVSVALASPEGLSLVAGTVIDIALPAVTGDGALWLATSGHPANDGGIRIEEQTEAGWREVSVHTPRARRDMQVIGGLTSNALRLVALGQHRLHGIGRFVAGPATSNTVLTPAGVRHSGTGEVATGAPFTLSTGDSAWVDFVTPEPLSSGVRDWFLEVDGTPQGYQPSAGALHARHAPIEEGPGAIKVFRLAGGIPNPFTSSTRVLFELPRATSVRLEVFDMQGRLIRRLEQRFEAGVQSLVWDRRMTGGSMAPRGVYPIRVTAGDERANGRLTLR